jgi:hypothetical protein
MARIERSSTGCAGRASPGVARVAAPAITLFKKSRRPAAGFFDFAIMFVSGDGGDPVPHLVAQAEAHATKTEIL